MTDAEILTHLQAGETLNFGCNGRNASVMKLMSDLEQQNMVETKDMGLEQETRRTVKWVGICAKSECDDKAITCIESEWVCQSHADKWPD